MKKLLLSLFTVLATTAFGQNSKQQNKISVGYSFSPDYCFRTLNNGDGSASNSSIIENRNDVEKAKFGYTTGFNLTFHSSGLLSVETGVQYSNKGYTTKEQDLLNTTPDPGFPNKIAINYSYQYIGIPLKAKFCFGKHKIHFISSAGFMTNFLIGAKQFVTYKYPNGKTEKKNQSSASGFNKIDISPMVSIGIDYKLNGKIHLSAEPTFRFGLSNLKDTPVKEKLWSAGLVFGISYSLK